MSANENSGAPRLERELRASVAWVARRGQPVAEAMRDGLEFVADELRRRAERAKGSP